MKFKVEVNLSGRVTFCDITNVFDAKAGNENHIRYDVSDKYLARACDHIQMRMSDDKYVGTKAFYQYMLVDPKHPDDLMDFDK